MGASSPTFWSDPSPFLLSLTQRRPFLHLSCVAGPGLQGSSRGGDKSHCFLEALPAGKTARARRLLRPHARSRTRHRPALPTGPWDQGTGQGHRAPGRTTLRRRSPSQGLGLSLPLRPRRAPPVPLVLPAPPPPPQGACAPLASLSSAPRTFGVKGRRREGWRDTGFSKQTAWGAGSR